MDGTLDFANVHWGRAFNPDNATQTQSISVKTSGKYLFSHAKGQNLVNSESCPIL